MAEYHFAQKLTREPDAFYAIGKIGDWARQSGTGEHLGDWPTQQLRKALLALKVEIARTGRNPDKDPIGIAGELPLIVYALDQLEMIMTDKPSEIASRRAAEVFQGFLYCKFSHLLAIARELDAEYGGDKS